MKASQFALDGGEIISKITQLENECKIEFEHVHVKTRNDNDDNGHVHEKQLVLECDTIANEVRIKCVDRETIKNVQVRGNFSLKHKNKHHDKKVSEVTKKIDSSRNAKECFQDKHSGKWNLIDLEARKGFIRSTES